MAILQLDLFDKPSELSLLKNDISEIHEKSENVRKGIFARHNALAKLYMDLYEKCTRLEMEIDTFKKLIKHPLE